MIKEQTGFFALFVIKCKIINQFWHFIPLPPLSHPYEQCPLQLCHKVLFLLPTPCRTLLLFFLCGPLLQGDIFLTTLYGIYFQSSLHILHITNHDGRSVWAAIHVLHSGHFSGRTLSKRGFSYRRKIWDSVYIYRYVDKNTQKMLYRCHCSHFQVETYKHLGFKIDCIMCSM